MFLCSVKAFIMDPSFNVFYSLNVVFLWAFYTVRSFSWFEVSLFWMFYDLYFSILVSPSTCFLNWYMVTIILHNESFYIIFFSLHSRGCWNLDILPCARFIDFDKLLQPEPQIYHKKQKPAWLDSFLRTDFLGACLIHEGRKSELNVYCINCDAGMCESCVSADAHSNHKKLQIYKHVHKDVVLLADMQKHIDCSQIQVPLSICWLKSLYKHFNFYIIDIHRIFPLGLYVCCPNFKNMTSPMLLLEINIPLVVGRAQTSCVKDSTIYFFPSCVIY